MWKSIHQLPPKHAEVIFLYNHDLLPTNERMKRLNQRKTAHCPICKICKETLKHLTIRCSRRKDTTRWILKSLRKQGYKGKLDEALRGMVKKKEELVTVAASLWAIWKARKRGSVPKAYQIEKEIRGIKEQLIETNEARKEKNKLK